LRIEFPHPVENFFTTCGKLENACGKLEDFCGKPLRTLQLLASAICKNLSRAYHI
jgi:hypothetical protein